MRKITIAIDGYSSCGKSTVAKALAKQLGYSYIDTGAMYRAATLYFLKHCQKIYLATSHAIPEIPKEELTKLLAGISITFQVNRQTGMSEVYLNGKNVEREIRQMKVSGQVSHFSAIREVRQRLVMMQQEMGKQQGVVLEGRDIGTIVFPDAELKIFMTADILVRTQRRYHELLAKGLLVSFDEVKKNIEKRDYDDTHRTESPLIKAPDAVTLDTTRLTPELQLHFILNLAEEKIRS